MIPQLHPTTAMSDWETGARNALKEEYPTTKLSGCWFHYTQAIWRRIQKAGLIQVFRENKEFTAFIKNLMAITFLPPDLIRSTYSQLQVPPLHNNDGSKLKRIIGYFERQWLTKVLPEELSIFDIDKRTNNGAECYHRQLKGRIKCSHPRIWNFLSILNEIITDTNLEIVRCLQGLEITRPRKKKNVLHEKRRALFKAKLISGCYSPLQYLKSIDVQ